VPHGGTAGNKRKQNKPLNPIHDMTNSSQTARQSNSRIYTLKTLGPAAVLSIGAAAPTANLAIDPLGISLQ
jgi:hypothetical protein